MRRVLLFGVACAVLAGLVIWVGGLLAIDFQNVLVGIAAGAILGLVRQRTPVARLGAFLIGFVLGVVLYGAKLALLPATTAGNLVATVGFILVCTIISALTKDRMQLWAMLLGGMLFASVYNSFAVATPWYALSQIPSVAAALLATSSAGFLVTLLVELREKRGGVDPVDPMAPADAGPAVVRPVAAGAAVSADSGLQVLNGNNGGTK